MTAPAAAPGLIARLGLAVASPRWALAVAGDRRAAGRSGTDLIALIAIVLVATRLRGLVGGVWLGAEIDAGLGLRAVVGILTQALTLDLGFLVLAALALWLGAGRRRDLGRAFDLACVAAVPVFLVDLVAIVIARAADAAIPPAIGWLVWTAGWAWSGALVALAWRPARMSPPAPPPVPAAAARRARRAGAAVIAVAIAGAALHAVWLARNLDLVRPVDDGMPAPAYALPRIEAGGALGAPLSRAPGRVTVLDFWATWCEPCLRAMPKLDELAARHADVDVVAINLDDAAQARALFDQRGWRSILLVADAGGTSERYGVTAIPHTVVIDRDGMVRHVARGDSHTVAGAVQRALERPRAP